MKIARICLRVLTVLLAAASLLMFFFTFAEIRFSGSDVVLGVSGAEMAFGADVTSRVPELEAGVTASLYKSSWFTIGLIWAALTTLIAALGFKFKKALKAVPVFSLLGGILMLVLVLGKGATYVDVGNLNSLLTIESISIEPVCGVKLCAVLCVGAFGRWPDSDQRPHRGARVQGRQNRYPQTHRPLLPRLQGRDQKDRLAAPASRCCAIRWSCW